MKYGFEREYFVRAKGQYVLCPSVMAHDDCGFLAESRGEPHDDPYAAAHLLLAEEQKLSEQATRNRVKLVLKNEAELSPELLREALRRFGKSKYPSERGNIYGKDYPADDKRSLAGLHVHFSNQRQVKDSKDKVIATVNGFIDLPKYVLYLDKVFAAQIQEAKRVPGCYELKSYGFEYRSLPTTVDPTVVATALYNLGR